ncbi:aminoglycoside phosphotransferase family protein [Kribbella sp. NPDC056861]|uniref:phosphotransferase family protein n=1 Tax=Kribbella sp. NPDC056861 TaxID=3154857 RepID=UPI00343DCA15
MEIAAMVEQACPGSDIAAIVPRSGGQLSTVFEVRRYAAAPLIVKLYEPEWAWKQAKEVYVYGILQQQLAGSIPEVVHVGPAFTVLTKLDGVPLSEAEPPDWRAVYRQLGELLAKIHRIPQPAYGYLTDQVLDPLFGNATKPVPCHPTFMKGQRRQARRAHRWVRRAAGRLAAADDAVPALSLARALGLVQVDRHRRSARQHRGRHGRDRPAASLTQYRGWHASCRL